MEKVSKVVYCSSYGAYVLPSILLYYAAMAKALDLDIRNFYIYGRDNDAPNTVKFPLSSPYVFEQVSKEDHQYVYKLIGQSPELCTPSLHDFIISDVWFPYALKEKDAKELLSNSKIYYTFSSYNLPRHDKYIVKALERIKEFGSEEEKKAVSHLSISSDEYSKAYRIIELYDGMEKVEWASGDWVAIDD